MTTDERLTRMDDKLDRLGEKIEKLSQDVTAECVLHTACRAVQKEHHTALYGNGGDGLKAEVADLQHSRQVARWGFRLLWTAFFALVAAVAGGAAQAWFRG